MDDKRFIDLVATAKAAFPSGTGNPLQLLHQDLVEMRELLTTTPEHGLTLTVIFDDQGRRLRYTIQSSDWQKLGSDYTGAADFEFHMEGGDLTVRHTNHLVSTIDGTDPREERTELHAYLEAQGSTSHWDAIAMVAKATHDMMSVAAQETLGHTPELRTSEKPVARFLRQFFPAVPCGVVELEQAFKDLHVLLEKHTNGHLEAGVTRVHRDYHEFWVGCSLKGALAYDEDSWNGEHDRVGWSVAYHQDDLARYGVDQTEYQFDGFDNGTPELIDLSSQGWIPLTAADIFGRAVSWIESGMDTLSDDLQAGLLAILGRFPPNPVEKRPRLQADARNDL